MDDQSAWESLDQLEAKYNELSVQASANIALLKRLCTEKDLTLEVSYSLLETYRQHDELQKAEIARLRTALHFMVGFLHEDVENIETAQTIIALARKTVKDAITTE